VIFTKSSHSRSLDVNRTSSLPLGETSLGLLRQAHGMYGAKKIFVLRLGATLSQRVHYFFLLMYGVVKQPISYIPPLGAHENPTIWTDQGSPTAHPPKRNEKTKTLAPLRPPNPQIK
jgi:hypothetical protein